MTEVLTDRAVSESESKAFYDGKKDLVRARLAKRLRLGKFKTVPEYLRHVMTDKTGVEFSVLIDTLSTNLTSFFREVQHFDFLREKLLPKIMDRCKDQRRYKIRAWSAGTPDSPGGPGCPGGPVSPGSPFRPGLPLQSRASHFPSLFLSSVAKSHTPLAFKSQQFVPLTQSQVSFPPEQVVLSHKTVHCSTSQVPFCPDNPGSPGGPGSPVSPFGPGLPGLPRQSRTSHFPSLFLSSVYRSHTPLPFKSQQFVPLTQSQVSFPPGQVALLHRTVHCSTSQVPFLPVSPRSPLSP